MKQPVVALFLCLSLLTPYFTVSAETDAERRARLEAQLKNVEQQIAAQEQLVDGKRGERQSLERDLSIIEGEIKQVELGILARSVAIEQLSDQIGEKEVVLSILEERLVQQQDSLADLVRRDAMTDDVTLVEMMLSHDNLSDFFTVAATYQNLKDSLNESLKILHSIRGDTTDQKGQLEGKQETEGEMRRIQELEQERIEKKEKNKEHILTVTKGEEREYQALLNSQQRTASELRNALFQLLGGGGAIAFPEAVRLAKYAGSVTGLPPQTILAILEQESNIGKNLGGCLFTDQSSNKPVMHPTRDEPVFLALSGVLGFDPYTKKVSCPAYYGDGTRYGWGGAMGPSQFIPSTWAMYGGLVQSGGTWVYSQGSDKIRAINGGNGPSSPFNNQDAFIATALYLRDHGADGTNTNDRLAALRYYAGWGGASRPENAFYGTEVIVNKERLAQEIATLGL